MITGAAVGAPPLMGAMIMGYARGAVQKQSGMVGPLNRGFAGLHIAMMVGALTGASIGGSLVAWLSYGGCLITRKHSELNRQVRGAEGEGKGEEDK
jgi:hypothetical protein